MEGYKAFIRSGLDNDDLLYSRNNDYIFEVGETYTEPKAAMCIQGFHYCNDVRDVFKYYDYDATVCKITDLGEPITDGDGEKSCTTKIRIDYILDGVFDGVHFKNGLLHSPDNDTPAIVLKCGAKRWYKDGRLYRENELPSMEHPEFKLWTKNGVTHRDNDLPAIEFANGRKEWFQNGRRHRSGGVPAIELEDGQKEWWINGVQIQEQSFWRTHAPVFAAIAYICLFSLLEKYT